MSTPTPRKRAPRTTTPSSPRTTPSEYRIELHIGGAVIKNEGDTMLDALKGLQRPTKIITKGIVKVFHGDNTKEIFFMPVQMKRMFYPLAQTTYAKMLAMNI